MKYFIMSKLAMVE